MNLGDLLNRIGNLRRAPGGGGRKGMLAPHKPVLLLALLKLVRRGHPNRFSLSEVRPEFEALWRSYGWGTPPRPDYPIERLSYDQIWNYRKGEREGEFPKDVWRLISQERGRLIVAETLAETYFHPSESYKELVCVAGVTEAAEWVRLYPVDYRYRPKSQRFHKYQWIDVELEPRGRGSDHRKESRRPNLETLKIRGEPLSPKKGCRSAPRRGCAREPVSR